ncbi:PTS sugar transporter subunit IIA [Treponema lecithinolyticum]|jgi:Phosphotransferase system mannitol/fructose-specific IIA domain (Ntr-type)|uniref:Phosphoenolpyruvate-dependent sugar phosphotransferase system, EIIA 2 n=1 Tax=Treponema lecithinolyticum ATCC 700332 TaxID=1321815 RepID=A0ABN0NY94_TRELE|nr:PTS sugar transporter subunit IIA [Treponema lecithinolyticum]ERJ92635.1 phosphoenolpyruvate-dependent sugar phosphotransferase system, EIIA 2 [Treponema lecithinolyticum ATCC 700332]
MLLDKVFNPKAVNIDLKSEDKDEVFEELIEELVSVNPSLDRSVALAAVKEREAKMSTGIMSGIAVPHAKTSAVTDVQGAIGISRSGIDYDALDGKPVHLIVLILSGADSTELHLRVLKRLARLLENSEFYAELMEQKTAEAAYNVFCKYEKELK